MAKHFSPPSASRVPVPATIPVPVPVPIPSLEARLVEMADLQNGHTILELSCGDGALIRAVLESRVDFAGLTAVELNPDAVAKARDLVEAFDSVNVIEGDFPKIHLKRGDFDRVVMQPPTADNQDIIHVTHALTLLAPRGILVSVMAPNTRRKGFEEMLIGYHNFDISEEQGRIILIVRK